MVSIGRGRGPLINRPNNTHMNARANAQVDHLAAAQAERYTTALAVDGTPIYCWNKTTGVIPCSCSSAPQSALNNTVQDVNDPESAWTPDTSGASVGDSNEQSQSRYRPLGTAQLTNFSTEPMWQTVPQRLQPEATNPASDFDGPEDFDDLDAALRRQDAISDNGSGSAPNDPFNLFAGKILDCPVCLGTGYIDSWQLNGGARVIFDTSNEHAFAVVTGVDIDDSRNPTALNAVGDDAAVRWTYTLPYTWLSVVRLALYNRDAVVSSDAYTWTWTAPNGRTGTMTPESLATLQNTGATLQLQLTALQPFVFTHAELCWSYAPPVYAQFPELDQVYEDEFLDWNVTLSVELPIIAALREGDYITDARYRKVWKLNRLLRKTTSNGTTYGINSDLRALHTFEQLANQLNLFKDPREAALAVRTMALPYQPTPEPDQDVVIPAEGARWIIREW